MGDWSVDPADRTVSVVVTLDNKVVESFDLTPQEATAFLVTPAFMALDDGEASWDMQDVAPERHNELYGRMGDLHLSVWTAAEKQQGGAS